ncbi:hypothetical protein ISN45_Aa03g029280 [Arabidopsis thaliana x Arabidopsis arenosa]|uniref:PTB domain engulfment adapter n=1 Tax=Arabidopsis thaliana x Arabidopsis arenosa TaxID=1240361 RepID=A0A8T2AXB0_9BRAS|nr:hypothetical protein ISN45_Aa03g029280 [Arabidopsis thaliana x Arabidopsis arenosa]
MASLFTPSPTTTSAGGDAVYVAAVPLKAAAGPPQLIMSMAYSLNLSYLQHFMVIVFDFQPRNPESIEAAISVLSGNLIPGVVLERRLKKVPRQRCWLVGSCKGNAMEMAIDFNNSWGTDLRVGVHDCRNYTNELVQHLTGEIQILERLPRS